MRRGLSLLEVLFAIFVLAIGILSIMSLIPAAKSQIRDANSWDRSTDMAFSAIGNIWNRNMLRAVQTEPWVDADGDGAYFAANGDTFTDLDSDGVFDQWPAGVVWPYGVVLDPLFVAANEPAPEALTFPYQLGGVTPYGVTPIARTTAWPTLWGSVIHFPLAEKIFLSSDDITFTVPDGTGQRPIRSYDRGVDGAWGVAGTDDDSNGVTDDNTEAGWPGSDDTTVSDGRFSWLATVAPQEGPLPPDAYRVGIAVFRDRERLLPGGETMPGERMAWCDVIGGGLGGGDVRIRMEDGTPDDWLKVRPNQWLLLIGWKNAGPLATSVATPGGTGQNVMVMYWYRIVGAGNIDTETVVGTDWLTRYMTIEGEHLYYTDFAGVTNIGMGIDDDDDPMTNVIPYDADADAATGATFQVVLFTDCITVFERTIRND